MRIAPLAILTTASVVIISAHSLASATSPPAIGCPSLANLRILLRQVEQDVSAAAAILADAKADHLSCVVLKPEKVMASTERLALGGRAYECVGVRGTTVCHWTLAGTTAPADSPVNAPRQGKSTPGPARR